MPNRMRPLTAIVVVFLILTTITPLAAQDGLIVISLAMPEFVADQINEDVFAQFEAEHPNIKINLVAEGGLGFGFATEQEVDDYLDGIEDYVSTADVLTVNSSQISLEATRAGYYLDLSPLIVSDPSLDPGDFYEPLYVSFQWDGGFWALPAAADMITLIYKPDAFDAVGLAYPESWWTLDDLENAIRELAEYDEDGNVSAAAFLDLTNSIPLVFISLMGQGIYDDTIYPSVPNFDLPMLEDLVLQWTELQQEGLLGLSSDAGAGFGLDAPMVLAPTLLTGTPGQDSETRIALLPGGRAGLFVNGFAISSGTQYPEAAYELVKFLTSSPEVANALLPSVTPARRSIAGVETEGGGINQFLQFSPEVEAMIQVALDNGLPLSEARYSEYVATAILAVALEGADVRSALEEAEIEALDRLQAASDRAPDVQVIVATPPPEIVLAENEVSLTFGVQSLGFGGLPNEDRWDSLVEEFVANDFEVGDITIETPNPFTGTALSDLAEQYDCFYNSSNQVPGADLSLLRNIDPLMASDPNIDFNDFAGNLLAQVQRNGQTWAMPYILQPQALWYNTDLFDQYGAFYPYEGWAVTDFENALRTLKLDPEDPAPFVPRDFGGNYLFTLIVAYGGLPLDYRTDPVTIDFTNPVNVDAIRQVLDLAKDGYLDYQELASLGGGFGFGDTEEDVALYSQLLNSFFLSFLDNATNDSAYALTEFPQGLSYTALSYDLGGAYISANTQFGEPCYRFISFLGQHPDLFSGMPARRSQINDPQLAIDQGESAVDYYNRLDTLITQPNVILIPSGLGGDAAAAGDFLIQFWLTQAFDRYVLEDGDLEAELEVSQFFATGFQECSAGIPAYDPAVDTALTYFGYFRDCAVQIDPELESVLPSFG